MAEETPSGLRSYQVTAERQDETHARASSHGYTLTLGVRPGDPTAGLASTPPRLCWPR
jgi:hypothetical protein